MSMTNAMRVAAVVRDAGGRVVGRTRLQKIAYLLTAAGLEEGFGFAYKHYGPYSEELASSARRAALLDLLDETENQASWGGTYSTYVVSASSPEQTQSSRRLLASEAAAADAIELELAATAVFLSKEGHQDPWAETARRKPDKTEGGRIEKAKTLYRRLSSVQTPVPLPTIP